MRRRSSLWLIGFVLLGLLGLAIAVILFGGRDSYSSPSAESYNPSGTAAFAELLRREGFDVSVDKYALPRLREDDTAVMFILPAESYVEIEEEDSPRTRLHEHIRKHVEEGGRLVLIPIEEEFQYSSLMAMDFTLPVRRVGSDKQAVVNVTPMSGTDSEVFPYPDAVYPIWLTEEQRENHLVNLEKNESGVVASFRNGVLATNRFIALNDNASVLVDTVRTVAGPGGRVVFVEASVGNIHQPGLTEILGPWAEAAWFQFVFLGVVVLYTLGKPFGLHQNPRRKEQGSRELLDAVTFTLKRGRMTDFVLASAKEEAERAKLRQRVQESANDPRDEIDRTMAYLEAARDLKAPEEKTLDLVRKLDTLVLPRRRVSKRRKRG